MGIRFQAPPVRSEAQRERWEDWVRCRVDSVTMVMRARMTLGMVARRARPPAAEREVQAQVAVEGRAAVRALVRAGRAAGLGSSTRTSSVLPLRYMGSPDRSICR